MSVGTGLLTDEVSLSSDGFGCVPCSSEFVPDSIGCVPDEIIFTRLDWLSILLQAAIPSFPMASPVAHWLRAKA